MKPIIAFEIVDHGFESAQYFQGCGTSFTEFVDVATGTGDTAHAALEDALENLAQSDWDTSSITNNMDDEETVEKYLLGLGGLSEEDIEDNECQYYVSVRVR